MTIFLLLAGIAVCYFLSPYMEEGERKRARREGRATYVSNDGLRATDTGRKCVVMYGTGPNDPTAVFELTAGGGIGRCVEVYPCKGKN